LNIGVYGGTFNPIHFGHLRAAEEVFQKFKLNRVIFVPCAKPPHKNVGEIIDPLHRLKMAILSTTGNEHFSVSDLEIVRPGKSYTILTIRELKKQNPEAVIYFILGLDAFLEINTWHKWKELFGETNFIVTTRPGSPKVAVSKIIPAEVRKQFRYAAACREFTHQSGHKVFFTEVTSLDISASAIRGMVREGRSIRYLLPRRASEYITENKLYHK
jgi:nicotinate-nucleotide adenylyltransferase